MNSSSINSRVTRLFEKEPEIKQLRLDTHSGKISTGFYGPPSPERLARIQRAVRREFDGAWDISIHSDELSQLFHRHHHNDHVEEFHRSHPAHEPRLIWKRILLPRWRNRPVPAATIRDFRFMLLLAGVCGLSTLSGFLFQRVGFSGLLVASFFAIAYFTGGWFATQDLWRALKHGKIDIQFLMIAVALGALFVNAWTEGATLLFLFSLSNALEQFANYRTRKTIDSLLKTAPKQALRREGRAWIEVPVEKVERGDGLPR